MKWDERTDIKIAIVWLKESRQTEDNVKDNIITTIKRGMRTMMISPETYYEERTPSKIKIDGEKQVIVSESLVK